MPTRTYDMKCHRLAIDFLSEMNPPLSFKMWDHHAAILASDIQRLIDNYIEELENERNN